MQIKVYSTSSCRYCLKAKEYLTNRGFSFTEVLLDENPQEFQAMQDETNAMSVPVIQINDRYIIGFNPIQLEQVLK